jgi:hypothetical protein
VARTRSPGAVLRQKLASARKAARPAGREPRTDIDLRHDDKNHDMSRCSVCARPIDGMPSTTLGTNGEVHAACLADQLLQDAVIALVTLAVLVFAPAIVVWAG